jgi:hypothetical protein
VGVPPKVIRFRKPRTRSVRVALLEATVVTDDDPAESLQLARDWYRLYSSGCRHGACRRHRLRVTVLDERGGGLARRPIRRRPQAAAPAAPSASRTV